MKIKTTLTTLSAIIALAMMAFSQNNGLTVDAPNAAAGFSQFSMPQNMGAAINSASKEQLPVIAPNGLSFYFVSERPGGVGGRDIYVSQRATLSSAWGAAINMGNEFNTSSNDSIASISPDGREMFLDSDRPGGMGSSDIYLSRRTDPNDDSNWDIPVNIGAALNTASNDFFGNYFVDPATGSGTLFFNSTRPGGQGFNDIYQSTRNADGTFNAPVPVNELNSVANEQRTSISRDGLEFFFSSNRLGPATIFAIFVSTRASTSSPWSPPIAVASFNTTGSDGQPALSPDGTVLYFASGRPGNFGDGDIYSAVRVSVNRSSPADFDGDGRTDISIFRPSDGTWYIMQSGSNTFRAQQFGTNGDRIVPGDYDGDGRTDFAVFRQTPQQGIWYVLRSSDNSFFGFQWGLNTDKPVPGDYDGDGRTDIAVFRNGVWYIVQSSNGNIRYEHFGLSGDIPVAANAQ